MVDYLAKLPISERNIKLQYVINALAYFLLYIPLRVLVMQQTVDNGQIAMLMGYLFLLVLLLELPTGAFADLVGKKFTLIAAYIANGISMIFYIWANSFFGFVLAVSFQAIFEALRSGASDALVYDSLAQDGRESEFRSTNAKISQVVQLSLVIATFFGGWLGSFQLQLPFAVTFLFQLLAVGLSFLMVEPAIDTEKFTLKNYVKQTVLGTKHLFHSKKLRLLATLYILVGGIGWTFQRLVRDLVLIDVGYGASGIGTITGILRLINILLLVKIVRSEKLTKKGLDLLFLPFLMVISYTLGLWLDPVVSIFSVAGIMIVGTGRFIIYGPYLQHEISSRYRATSISAANMIVSLLLSVNLFGFGFLVDRFGLGKLMSLYGFLSLILVIPLSFKVRKEVLISR